MCDEFTAADVSRLLEEFRASRRDFQRRLDRIPPERWEMAPASGEWCTRDLVAHVAAWLDEANEEIPRLLLGVAATDYDVDAFNAAAVERARTWSPPQTLGAFRRAADRFDTIVGQSDPADLADDDGVSAWIQNAAEELMNEHFEELDRLAAVASGDVQG